MANRYQENEERGWSPREAYLLAMVCLFVGLIVGYLFRGSPTAVPTAQPQQQAAATPAGKSLQSPESLNVIAAPLLEAVKANPKDGDSLTRLGNLYFDHGFYPEAIKFYNQALEVKPKDVNVRTDLGTSYFYSGMSDKAIAEFEKSLAIDPTHENTLFNMGIVRLEGLKDPKGAIAAWEKLLPTVMDPQRKQQIEQLIAKARQS